MTHRAGMSQPSEFRGDRRQLGSDAILELLPRPESGDLEFLGCGVRRFRGQSLPMNCWARKQFWGNFWHRAFPIRQLTENQCATQATSGLQVIQHCLTKDLQPDPGSPQRGPPRMAESAAAVIAFFWSLSRRVEGNPNWI
jgi:hypothetical protein